MDEIEKFEKSLREHCENVDTLVYIRPGDSLEDFLEDVERHIEDPSLAHFEFDRSTCWIVEYKCPYSEDQIQRRVEEFKKKKNKNKEQFYKMMGC